MNYWPSGMKVDPIGSWPSALTEKRRASNFASTMSSTLATLRRELFQLDAEDVRLQVAIPASQFRLDGYPRATAKAEHPGIILTMQTNVGALSYPCDTFTTWEDNLRAIALALEALRKVDRYGVTKRGEQYRGFMAIEATAVPAGFTSADDAREFLRSVTGDLWKDVSASDSHLVRTAKRWAHPDMPGGDADRFQRVTLAEQYLKQNGAI
ncbi:hypothetical protein [Mycetocola miduiensis]|uniref:J domain-containing protein n=1 Tax=Mycetocola miduiensis TaxID=995034 RepID=A0A1I5AW60_9MICO|nr:hypothetical protein [Mycetocola miduiensis]SFN66678.1 hypothetical protein SAMN05216219_1576 [Mycetocola miduiensis]